MRVPDKQMLIDQAVLETGLSDFGDEWFFDHLDRLIPILNSQAHLSEAGAFGAQNMILSGLSNRLRHKDLLKKHPEILEEDITVTAILTGLPRSGSTMLHRMLVAAPYTTGVAWFETQNYAPLAGERRGNPEPRRKAAQTIMGHLLEALPELMSIHPMSIDQPDEEVIILGQLFSSSMIESTYYVPDYAAWLDQQNPRLVYTDLIEILQSLQWQNPARVRTQNRPAKSWVLKTPGHLIALETVLDSFPQAKIVMTHRDPVSTVPSYCSMMATLYKNSSSDITNSMIGEYWMPRLKMWLDTFLQVRKNTPRERFIDVDYTDLLDSPVAAGERVLQEAGIAVTETIRTDMAEWIEANKREHRAPHTYRLEDFDLTEVGINEAFTAYNQFKSRELER